jgi:chromosome segregation ATPase
MIEPIMFFGIGFLVATLFGLLLIPLVHNRAVRLTVRRLEAATPVSMAEIQADKDQLRAEFAMSTRRLEMSVEELKTKTTGQLAELGKKTDAINRLKLELGEKAATIFALEAREKALKDVLRATEEEFTVKSATLRDAERALADNEAEHKKLMSDFGERSITADSQRVELAALRAQAEVLKDKIAESERAVRETEERLAREREEADEASKAFTAERLKVENLAGRIAQLERQLVVQTTETEILGRRVHELEGRLADQGRLLAEREYECDRLRGEIDAASRRESDLRAELSTGRGRAISDEARAQRSALQGELESVQEERAKLQREIATIKREAEATWAAERVENALLRERINDVAAEVARLTAALEGPDSPIEAILATDASLAPAAVNGPNAGDAGKRRAVRGVSLPDMPDGSSSLADRIRALQMRASRLSSRT